MMMPKVQVLLLALAAGVAVWWFACKPNVTIRNVNLPDDVKNFYLANDWIPLPIADSKFGPGSIFSANAATGIRWISNLKTCGLPADLLRPVPSKFPKLTFSTDKRFDASAVLTVRGVEAGPEFKKVSTVSVEYGDQGGDALDLLAIRDWISTPENHDKFSPACTDFFKEPDSYFAQEAYRVSSGKYTLHDANGAKLNLKGLNLGVVKLSPNESATIDGDGNLTFTETVYTAVKRVRRVNGVFQTLGQGNEADDDVAVKALVAAQVKNTK